MLAYLKEEVYQIDFSIPEEISRKSVEEV